MGTALTASARYSAWSVTAPSLFRQGSELLWVRYHPDPVEPCFTAPGLAPLGLELPRRGLTQPADT